MKTFIIFYLRAIILSIKFSPNDMLIAFLLLRRFRLLKYHIDENEMLETLFCANSKGFVSLVRVVSCIRFG